MIEWKWEQCYWGGMEQNKYPLNCRYWLTELHSMVSTVLLWCDFDLDVEQTVIRNGFFRIWDLHNHVYGHSYFYIVRIESFAPMFNFHYNKLSICNCENLIYIMLGWCLMCENDIPTQYDINHQYRIVLVILYKL